MTGPAAIPATLSDRFAARLLRWFDHHGRKDLPWQRDRSPYRVWVSEVMLQQTRVSSVIDYYQRFMQHFPSLSALANAPIDEVLHLWSGLGYYARARNLHAAAQQVRDQYDGQFPQDFDQIAALPGIGRSTAGAILALACGQRHAILDGNVKRVLARHRGVDGWSGQVSVGRELWRLSEALTPQYRVDAYTQAIMDLGATVCVRGQADCKRCPLADDCVAYATDRVAELPTPKPRKQIPQRATRMLIIVNSNGEVLLQQRPPAGIWGGLWSLPECPPDADVAHWCRANLHMAVEDIETLSPLRHTFSHFHLDILPARATVRVAPDAVMDAPAQVWYNCAQPDRRGLAAPVQRLLSAHIPH